MQAIKKLSFSDIDSDDAMDILASLEASFGIRLADEQIENITTVEELVETFKQELGNNIKNDCSSQQAFYKLKKAIFHCSEINQNEIRPNTLLIKVFPIKKRKQKIKKLEKQLGFSTHVLKVPDWISAFLTLYGITSCIFLFFSINIGLVNLLICMSLFFLFTTFGKIALKHKTVGAFAKSLVKTDYHRIRRQPNTYNEAEVEQIIIDKFLVYV